MGLRIALSSSPILSLACDEKPKSTDDSAEESKTPHKPIDPGKQAEAERAKKRTLSDEERSLLKT